MKKMILIVLASFSLTSCWDDDIKPSGRKVTEERSLGEFDRIDIEAGEKIKVEYGNRYGIWVKGSDNLVSRLRTTVKNHKLELEYDAQNIGSEDLEITVTVPYFRELRIHGERKLTTRGTFEYTSRIDMYCIGENDVASGDPFATGHLEINLTGEGRTDLRTLAAKTAKATLTGDARLYVNASDALDAVLVGSGKIYYFGSPQVTTQITGSGTVSKM